jgi:hypothetical protein
LNQWKEINYSASGCGIMVNYFKSEIFFPLIYQDEFQLDKKVKFKTHTKRERNTQERGGIFFCFKERENQVDKLT